MLRQLKYRLIRTHVYSIESKDRLTRFGVTMFLYRIIRDGRNTAVLGVLTMNSELFYKYKKITHKYQQFGYYLLILILVFMLLQRVENTKEYCVSNLFYIVSLITFCDTFIFVLFLN